MVSETTEQRDPVDVAYDVFDRHCPSRATLDDVTSRWGMLVLAALDDGTLRFGELRRRVDGVSEKMLSQALQALERDGLVQRTQRSIMPPAVDYELTALGREAAALAVHMLRWLEAHMDRISAAQQQYEQAGGRTGRLTSAATMNPEETQ